MDNINNFDWELLDIDENGTIIENIEEPELTIDTSYEKDINELEENIDYKILLDVDDLNEIEENDFNVYDKTLEESEEFLEPVCLNDDFELDIELYENELIQAEQEDYFLREMQQRELNEYIKEEEEYKKYEEEMFRLYNNEEKDETDETDSEVYSYEESSSSSEESESSEEEEKTRSRKLKKKNKFSQIIDNKFVFCLGAYLIYEIIYGTE